jgi:hypothetical protein
MDNLIFDAFYDAKPAAMLNYLRYNGPHFSEKLCAFAASHMTRDEKPIKPFSKEEVDNMLKANGITLKNNALYDHVFVANMGKADYLGKSIPNEKYLALHIKDVIDDEDGYDGLPFSRWYADMSRKGIPIDWDECL